MNEVEFEIVVYEPEDLEDLELNELVLGGADPE